MLKVEKSGYVYTIQVALEEWILAFCRVIFFIIGVLDAMKVLFSSYKLQIITTGSVRIW